MRKSLSLYLAASILALACVSVSLAESGNAAVHRGWIEDMKTAERGPFSRIRWFCNDGTVLPPRAYACQPHGGGHQHGEWSDRTVELRQQGYLIANLLAGLKPDSFLANPGVGDALAQLLIERYLISADDGWIFRRALFYRGAIQEEDERKGARALLTEMAARNEWIGPRYPVLRAAARLLPHGKDSASVQKVRQMSASLSDRDDGFKPLRAKIHGAPGSEDAKRVRAYAAGLDTAAREPYLALAEEIDRVYRAPPLEQNLEALAAKYTAAPWLQEMLNNAAAQLRADDSATNRFAVTGALLASLRRSLPQVRSAGARLEVIDLGLRTEGENFRAASELRRGLASATRKTRWSGSLRYRSDECAPAGRVGQGARSSQRGYDRSRALHAGTELPWSRARMGYAEAAHAFLRRDGKTGRG
jgi:hypothetical protein